MDAKGNDRFVVMGSYAGDGGRLAIQTVRGNDRSPSDQLVVNGGGASASAAILVNNVNGPGALTTGSEENWFLRSEALTPTPTPTPTPVPIPTIRPEVPGYSILPTLARETGSMEIASFHERRGVQMLLLNNGDHLAAWGRIYDEQRRQAGHQTVAGTDFRLAPSFDGDIWGIQAGVDLVASTGNDGSQFRKPAGTARVVIGLQRPGFLAP
ncbi:autotransporter outer membrane beta-barrel domain-containing protein [Novosphingobium sp. BL-8H]|uniref:autotransporter outer membrane beta-barrel domain-containing protein n=1 Tax=Novosphingobium sp. BL-8H TaxID=3127640 RepID=UPI0037565F7B